MRDVIGNAGTYRLVSLISSHLVRLRLVDMKDLVGTVPPREFWKTVTERLRGRFGKSFVKSRAQVHEKWRNLDKCYRAKKRTGKMTGAIYQLIDSLTSGNHSHPDIETEGGEAVTVVDICSIPNKSARRCTYKRQRTPAPSSMMSYAGLPYSSESQQIPYQSVPAVEPAASNESLVEVLSTLKTLISNQERLLQQQERLLIHQERILTTQDNTAILQQSVASSFAVITSLLGQRAPGNTGGTSASSSS